MKRSVLKTAAIILLILAGSLASCGKEQEKEPAEIPFKEYSLVDTNCRWTNLDFDGSVIVINSKTELEKYVIRTDGSYSEIDFAKKYIVVGKWRFRWDCRNDNFISSDFFY